MATGDVCTKTGLSFSGGGVRSTAFCSGVLRRLLQKGASIDYLSSVSGGGYTGASYVEWKCRNGGKDDPSWHKEFFENLRKFSNPFCDCFSPVRGIFDGLVSILVLFLLSIGISFVTAFSFMMPTTVIVDYLFGSILRDQFDCKIANKTDTGQLQIPGDKKKSFRLCRPRFGPKMEEMMLTILPLFAIFVLSYYLSSLVKQRTVKYLLKLVARLAGFIFAMVFLPWFLELFKHFSPSSAKYFIIVLVVIVWICFPSLRSKASIALFILIYAYAVKWTVFKTPIADVPYSDSLYDKLLWVAAILLWIHPYLAALQMSGIGRYVEWRLSRAFYFPQSNMAGCSISCCNATKEKPLTLADLANIKPHYNCNVTVNKWRKTDAESEKDYEVLTLSPTNIERVDCGKDEIEFNQKGFIEPKDIRLAFAMATSASSVSYDQGMYGEGSDRSFRDIQAFLGMGIGKHLVSQTHLTRDWMSWVVTFLIQMLFGAIVLAIPALLYFEVLHDRRYWMVVTMALFGFIFVSVSVIAVMPSGDSNKGCWSKFIRWCIINIIHVRVLRNLLDITDTGPTPPPVMSLSDGGHLENLGILPLLKLRLPRIIAVNAGSDSNYAATLLYALNQAREKLRCSFTGMSGRDIIEDIRDNFVEKEPGEQPRSYRFKVQYYEKDDFEKKLVGEGEVMLLMPRHPDDGLCQFHGKTWKDFDDGDVKLDLDESIWGPGPACKASEVDRLSGCFWECCHFKLWNIILNPFTGIFPLHSTLNQMFTRSQHVAYHREGYHACLEAEADKFFKAGQYETTVKVQPSTTVTPTVITVGEL